MCAYIYKILLLSLLAVSPLAHGQTNFRIAFGSCSQQASDEQFWDEIAYTKPAIWIWGGDNVYGDTHDLSLLKAKYEGQKNRESYQRFIKKNLITGSWDDHDYGINDGGKQFSKKSESKELAANFLGFSKINPVWKHEGLYNSTLIKKKKEIVKIINLDTRYFRDTIYKQFIVDTLTKKRISYYATNPTGDVLGNEQWNWLEEELKNSSAAVTIINSSIQVISEEHRFEKWANLPNAQTKLYDLLKRYPKKKVIIISGDRHIAELSKREFPELSYPLYDFTSSGLTHTWSEVWPEENRYREGKLIIEKNFGLIDITIKENIVKIVFTVMGKAGKTLLISEATL